MFLHDVLVAVAVVIAKAPYYPASTATMAPPKTVTTPSRESTTLVSTTEKLSHISGTTFGYKCHEYTVYKLPPAERPKWNESRNLCSESGSHLVCIEHQEEIDFLAYKLEELKLESEYFIGLEEQNEKWTWICNRSTVVTPKKSPWAVHQPSGSGPCAKMYFVRKDLVYEDIPCDVRKNYICERRNSSCHKKAEPDIDEKGTIKPTTIHTLPDISVATDSVITTRQQHEGGKRRHIGVIMRQKVINSSKNSDSGPLSMGQHEFPFAQQQEILNASVTEDRATPVSLLNHRSPLGLLA